MHWVLADQATHERYECARLEVLCRDDGFNLGCVMQFNGYTTTYAHVYFTNGECRRLGAYPNFDFAKGEVELAIERMATAD
jgi:hypothetical protein